MLNAQRVANGIPGHLVHAPLMTDGCAKHNNYIALNGGVLVHGENPANPGYTPEGARVAPGSGSWEVLSTLKKWDNLWVNPWDRGPLHAIPMFDPVLSQAGYDAGPVSTCMRFDTPVPVPAAVFTVPGNGARSVPLAMDSSAEGPYSPNDVAGVPEDQAGFNILVYRTGGSIDLAAATLTGPGGSVEVRIVDGRSTVPGGALWRWSAAVIVPTNRLAPLSDYTLDMTFTDGLTHHSTFRTTAVIPYLTMTAGGGSGGFGMTVDSRSEVRAWATGPTGSITLAPQRTEVWPVNEFNPYPRTVSSYNVSGAAPGIWSVCAATGGPGTTFFQESECRQVTVTDPPPPSPTIIVPSTPTSGAVPAPALPAEQPVAAVQATVIDRGNKIRVDVNPDKPKGYWKVRLQKKAPNGTWKWAGTAKRTKGSADRYTFNPKAGTYRVHVAAKYGYAPGMSAEVRLKR